MKAAMHENLITDAGFILMALRNVAFTLKVAADHPLEHEAARIAEKACANVEAVERLLQKTWNDPRAPAPVGGLRLAGGGA